MGSVDAPRCANQVHVRGERGAVEASSVCSCAAGLIHMHDCPVAAGLECCHFRPLDEEPPALSAKEGEDVRERLMADYLSRPYYHRVRGLAPAGDAWRRRREELYAYYATVELGPDSGPRQDSEDESYERERERLIAQRKKREEARAAREERTREEKAKERARLGIKTVVEKAQEAVAQKGNIASSIIDDVELPPGKKRPRRRRRKSGGGGPPDKPGAKPAGKKPAPGKPAAEGQGPPKKTRRRRRRRRGGKGGGPGSGGGGAPAA